MSHQLLRIGKAWRIAKEAGINPGRVQCMTYRGGGHGFTCYLLDYETWYIDPGKPAYKATHQLYRPVRGKYERA